MMRVLVCGGRNYCDRAKVFDELEILHAFNMGDYAGLDRKRLKPLRWLRQGGGAVLIFFCWISGCWAEGIGMDRRDWFYVFLFTIDIAILLGLLFALVVGVSFLIELKRISRELVDKKKSSHNEKSDG